MKKRRGLISNYFKPSLYVRSFRDVNVAQLKRQGIKLFICDLDNTLVPHYTRLPNKDNLEFIKKVQDAGIEFVLMSNNVKSRVGMFAKRSGIEHWHSNARKPFKRVAKAIIDKRDIDPSKVVFMGDQVVMDILVANRLKAESILVQPLVSTDYKMSSFNLFLENRIYKNLEKKNILKRGSSQRDHLVKLLNYYNMKTIGSVESFTGGLFASTIISKPGASEFFKGAVVSYDNEIKEKLGVDTSNGVINKQVAIDMALKGKEFLGVDLCIAFTGNAGPKVMDDKEVGLVYIAFNEKVYELRLSGDRNQIRKQAVEFALNKI